MRWPSAISTISATTRSSKWIASTSSCSAASTNCARQVRKSDQAVEEYRRKYDLYKSSGVSGSGGVTTQQLTELNTQLLAAQTAKAEADLRLREAQQMRKGGLQAARASQKC